MLPTTAAPPFCHQPTAPAEPAEWAAAYRSWQTVHEHLTAQALGGLAPASLADFAVYYACVYHAWGAPADRGLAQGLVQRLAAQPWPGPGGRWAAPQVNQAIALAWLSAHDAGWATSAPLNVLDELLYQEANYLLTQPHGLRSLLGLIARYLRLRLRLPAPHIAGYLHDLLTRWPATPAATATAPLLLGLDGLAAELLGLIHAHRAGTTPALIQTRVQQGLRSILATRRDVDFSEHAYAIFPYQLSGAAPPPCFSAEMSWRRGDAGLAWLLYEAQAMLPDAELRHMAELVGLHTLLRTSARTTAVVGPGFYQGAAGVAHLYAQLYRLSRLPAYRSAQDYWLARTRELLPPVLNGTLLRHLPHEPLGGLVGVGFVLLAAVHEDLPNWAAVLV